MKFQGIDHAFTPSDDVLDPDALDDHEWLFDAMDDPLAVATLAQTELDSVHGEVIRLVAVSTEEGLEYWIRSFDFDHASRVQVGEAHTERLPSLSELVAVIDGSAEASVPLSPTFYLEMNVDDVSSQSEIEALGRFARVTSEVYPGLEAHYAQVIARWVEGKLGGC